MIASFLGPFLAMVSYSNAVLKLRWTTPMKAQHAFSWTLKKSFHRLQRIEYKSPFFLVFLRSFSLFCKQESDYEGNSCQCRMSSGHCLIVHVCLFCSGVRAK